MPVPPLDAADRARLDALLSAPPYRDRAMALDELQGLCAAMAMGPDPEISRRWLDLALGENDEQQTPAELLLLLERFRASTAEALDRRALEIDARTTRTGRVDHAPWCRGFLVGVDMSETDWFDVADAEDLHELLFPIEVIADTLPEEERASYRPGEWRQLVRDAEARLPEAVKRLADYWAIVRAPPGTVRRDAPKVGRNDPCPCGSGRKFKQCHGRGE